MFNNHTEAAASSLSLSASPATIRAAPSVPSISRTSAADRRIWVRRNFGELMQGRVTPLLITTTANFNYQDSLVP